MIYNDIHIDLPPGQDKSDRFENYRTDVVTKIAYLIGVSDDGLSKETNFKPELVSELAKNDNAHVIRSLCVLRTGFLLNYEKIRNERRNFTQINQMNDYLRLEEMNYLQEQGIDVAYINTKNNFDPSVYVAYINQYILDRIGNLKSLFPDWIKFEYIRDLFLMPGAYAGPKGSNIDTQKKFNKVTTVINDVKNKYRNSRDKYPYHAYIAWPKEFKDTDGNVLLNDSKFLKLLYGARNDTFKATEYVIDAKEKEKASIYDFIAKARKISIFVDCENVNPYSFVAMIMNLDSGNLSKIDKVILYDDVNTSSAWDLISDYVELTVVRQEFKRVLDNKSLIDVVMAVGVCKEFYSEGTESIIIASSDSDFWGCISSLPDARFFVLNESSRTSPAIIEKLDENKIEHCFMDDFAQDRAQDFKTKVLLSSLAGRIKNFNETGTFETLNVNELIDTIFYEARVIGGDTQIEQEKRQFYRNFLRGGLLLRPDESDDGSITFKMEINRTK